LPPAAAQTSSSRAAKKAPAPAAKPQAAPGQATACAYRRFEDGTPQTIKDCQVRGNAGEFDVEIAFRQTLLVRLDEPLVMVVPASDHQMTITTATNPDGSIVPGTDYVIYDLKSDALRAGWSSSITTASYDVTLRFRRVGDRGDSQAHVALQDRAERDRVCAHLVETERERQRTECDRERSAVESSAEVRARTALATSFLHGVTQSSPGVRPVRQDDVVLRAEGVIRMKRHPARYLAITLENREPPTFHIEAIEAWLERGAAPTREPLDLVWVCEQTIVPDGKRIPCLLDLGLTAPPGKNDRVGVRVFGQGKRRSVTQTGIDVR
jgi:hypothetical protein